MRSRIVNLACLLLIMVSACGANPSAPASLPTPTNIYLVTVPADATPTPTPFQPVAFNDLLATAPAFTETPPPVEPTIDPNALVTATSTPESFYIPPYAPEPSTILSGKDMVTFLLLGSDKRPGQTYFRTDTIVIVVVRPAAGQVALISVPRDLWVYIPTVGMDRINTAYEYGEMPKYNYPGGGFALLKDTILYNMGLSVDHLAIVDFDGFRRIVDTLGGVDVPVFCSYTDWHLIDPSYNPENENNWALFTVGPGLVHMDGDLALWYARSRKRSSDFDRGRRSQEVLRALFTRAMQTNSISKIPELYTDFSSAIITDLTLPNLLELAPLALHFNNADIRSYYIGRDYVSGWMTPGGASVLLPNEPAIKSLIQQALSPAPRAPEAEALTIEVRNGTSNSGWDSLAAERLNYVGYNTRLADADRQDYASSLLYDLSAAPDLTSATSLLNILGLPPAAYVSSPQQVDVNYVLVVGEDFQPCFNPATITP
jgi:polyisoprenyl-teichoic acid--peptidoglycan teichoic acid transferase